MSKFATIEPKARKAIELAGGTISPSHNLFDVDWLQGTEDDSAEVIDRQEAKDYRFWEWLLPIIGQRVGMDTRNSTLRIVERDELMNQ